MWHTRAAAAHAALAFLAACAALVLPAAWAYASAPSAPGVDLAGKGDSSLYAALHGVRFKHSGTVKASDVYGVKSIPALYLEPENVTRATYAWSTPLNVSTVARWS